MGREGGGPSMLSAEGWWGLGKLREGGWGEGECHGSLFFPPPSLGLIRMHVGCRVMSDHVASQQDALLVKQEALLIKQDAFAVKQDALLLKLRQRRASQAERDDDPAQ